MKDQFIKQLFSKPELAVYALADGASCKGLLEAIALTKPEFACLFYGKLHPQLAEVAPYIIRLELSSPITDWLIRQWGKHVAVYALIDKNESFADVRKHFHSLVEIKNHEDKSRVFRFYDPRVMRTIFPMLEPAQVKEMFGPVKMYIYEGKQAGEILRCWQGVGGIEYKQFSY